MLAGPRALRTDKNLHKELQKMTTAEERSMRLYRALDAFKGEDAQLTEIDAATGRFDAAVARIERNGICGLYRFAPMPTRDTDEGPVPDDTALIQALTDVCMIPDAKRTSVALLSCAEPFPRPAWMSNIACDAATRSAYAGSFTAKMATAFEADDGDGLCAFVRAALRVTIAPIGPDRLFGKALPAEISRDITDSLLTIHAADIAAALRGHGGHRTAIAYAALAAATPYAIPIGQPLNSPRNNPWIVAVA